MKNTSWGRVAHWYDRSLEKDDNTFQNKVILPNLIRIVSPRKGMHILDVACGQGFFSRAFAESGADITGCDISPELIDLARKQSSKDLNYFVSSADLFSGHVSVREKLTHNEKGLFDVITIVLALQNIDNMAGTMAECSKVLGRGGRLIVVLNHPAFRIPGASSWQWDEGVTTGGKSSTGKHSPILFRRVDAYMSDRSSTIDMTPGEKDCSKKEATVSFHRPLQSYFKALAKAGFSVVRLEEWISHRQSQAGPRSSEEDRARKEIPMFLCLEAVNML